jgi:hypothetical protein
MGSALSAPSPAKRLWRAAVRLASSVGGVDEEVLQPARLKAKARAVAAMRARDAGRRLMAYIGPHFVSRAVALSNRVNHGTAVRCKRFVRGFTLKQEATSIPSIGRNLPQNGTTDTLPSGRTRGEDGNLIWREGIH